MVKSDKKYKTNHVGTPNLSLEALVMIPVLKQHTFLTSAALKLLPYMQLTLRALLMIDVPYYECAFCATMCPN